jgi:hypothetical protein
MRTDAANPRILLGDPFDDLARPVGAGVVDDDQFVVDLLAFERRSECGERGPDAVDLVVGRDNCRELQETTVQSSAFAS